MQSSKILNSWCRFTSLIEDSNKSAIYSNCLSSLQILRPLELVLNTIWKYEGKMFGEFLWNFYYIYIFGQETQKFLLDVFCEDITCICLNYICDAQIALNFQSLNVLFLTENHLGNFIAELNQRNNFAVFCNNKLEMLRSTKRKRNFSISEKISIFYLHYEIPLCATIGNMLQKTNFLIDQVTLTYKNNWITSACLPYPYKLEDILWQFFFKETFLLTTTYLTPEEEKELQIIKGWKILFN